MTERGGEVGLRLGTGICASAGTGRSRRLAQQPVRGQVQISQFWVSGARSATPIAFAQYLWINQAPSNINERRQGALA
jgi:hypothetical protein